MKKLSDNSLTLTAAVLVAAATMIFAGTAQAQAGSGTASGTGTTTATHKASGTGAASAATSGSTAAAKGIPPVKGLPRTMYALKYIDIKVGTGELAPATGIFTVHYTGWLAADGKKFDSSVDRGEPAKFPVGAHRVIVGWDTGFAGMRVGGKRRLLIPYQLAYGETGRPPVIPAKANLIFDVELIAVAPLPQGPPPGGRPQGAGPGGARPQGAPPTGGTTPPAGTPPPAGATPPAGTTPPPGNAPPSGTTSPATPQAAPQGTGPSAKIPPTFDK